MELQVWESKAIKGKDIDDVQRPDREGLEVFDSRDDVAADPLFINPSSFAMPTS